MAIGVVSAPLRAALPPSVTTAGLTPQQAVQAMTLPPGFRATLVAGEPEVHQPVAFTTDDRGRLWVVENFSYPDWSPYGRDRIVIFEDTDGDGYAEKRTVFYDQLNFATGIAWGLGGVWVGSAPYLLFIPDRNRDDRPDGPPRVMLDGWGHKDTHETLNSLIWGPDGWLYGNQGIFTPSAVQSPERRDVAPVAATACVWRFHPTKHRFEIFAEGISNQWGLDFNDHGHAFVTACVIPHLWHVVQGGRYRRQVGRDPNPYAYELLQTAGDHVHWAGPSNKDWEQNHGVAGGGHAHAGATFYLADTFPREFRGALFMHNLLGNRINVDRPEPAGSGYIGRHAPDFMLANDGWFRGLKLEVGPDGSLFGNDWYDQRACHPERPNDATNGRLYKYSFGEPKRDPAAVIDLAKLPSAELVQLQLHPNDWHVRHARTLLQERGPDPAVHAALLKIIRELDDVTRRLRALWALHITDGLDETLALELLADREPHIRAWAIQLAGENEKPSAALLSALTTLAQNDPSPIVRLYLASAAQRIPVARRWPLVEALLARTEAAQDQNLPLMNWYATEPLVLTDPARALALSAKTALPKTRALIVRRVADLIAESQSAPTKAANAAPTAPADLFERLVTQLAATRDSAFRRDIVESLLTAFAGKSQITPPPGWRAAFDACRGSGDATLIAKAELLAAKFGDRSVLAKHERRLTEAAAPLADRAHSLEVILQVNDPVFVPLLHQALAEPKLRAAALRGLATHENPGTPSAVIRVFMELDPAEKRQAIALLAARPAFARELLAAVKAGAIPRRELGATVARQLRMLGDPAVDRALNETLGVVRDLPDTAAQEIARWQRTITPARLAAGNARRGRVVFAQACASCHTMFGEGGKLGPELTGSNRSDLDYLLTNIVDPNATIGKDYQLTTVETTNGRTVSGLIFAETPASITLTSPAETLTLPRREIRNLQQLDVSMMPAGLLTQMPEEDVIDLFLYLRMPSQVPLPETHSSVP